AVREEREPFDGAHEQHYPGSGSAAAVPGLHAVPPQGRAGVDYELVRRLRRVVGGKLAEQRRRYANAGTPLAGDDERQLVRSLIDEATRDYAAEELAASRVVPVGEVEALGRAVWSSMYEADRLQALLNDDSVETINIIGCDKAF